MIAVLAVMLFTSPVAPVCEDARIRVRGPAPERWLEPIRAACERLASLPGLDPSARVRLEPSEAALRVVVMLDDGREALRDVRAPEELEPTLEALLTIPPAAPPAPVEPAPVAPVVVKAPANVVETAPAKVPPLPREATFGVELGASVGVRLAGAEPFMAVSPELSAELRAGRWLFGLTFDVDVYAIADEDAVHGEEMSSVAGGLTVARRFVLTPSMSLDVGATPRFVLESQSYLTGDGERSEVTFSATDVRLGVRARVAFGEDEWRWTVSLGAELSPSRLSKGLRLDPLLDPLPTWSAVLSLGVVWGEP